MKMSLKILIHTIFWLVFLGITVSSVLSSYAKTITSESLPHIVINIIWGLTIFYTFYFYFIKNFEKGEFVKYLIQSILASVAVTILFLPFHKLFYSDFPIFKLKHFAPPTIGSFVLAQCGSLVRGFENWVDNIKLKAELEIRNTKNELELLKSQINPHFLFNTLNNIDTLIHKSPDDASRSLLTLSEMLRYMIYETNTDTVDINKELDYIKHFIELQKLRLSDVNFIKADLPLNCSNIKIAPMLLLPFIENAFKYATINSQLPAIIIHLICDQNQLFFKCKNYYSNTSSKNIHSGGVGLDNVKRRLELIYPNKYSLTILDENNMYNVDLKIDTN